jgi:hypothetical protein
MSYGLLSHRLRRLYIMNRFGAENGFQPVFLHGTLESSMSSGPQYFRISLISGQLIPYGAVLAKGLRISRFFFRISEAHPYGSVSKGFAAFSSSPSVASCRSNPSEASGSMPTKTNWSCGQRRALACSCSKRRCLNVNDTMVIFVGYVFVTS